MKTFVLFLVLAIFGIACTSSADKTKTATEATAAALKTINLEVKGMSCTGCEETIKEEVGKIEGVSECVASFEKGLATVKFDSTKTTTKAISDAITSAGYEVTGEAKTN